MQVENRTRHSNFYMVEIHINPIPYYYHALNNTPRPATHARDAMENWLTSIDAEEYIEGSGWNIRRFYVIKNVPIALVPTESDVLSFLYQYKSGIPDVLQAHWRTDEVYVRDFLEERGYYFLQFTNFMSNENWIEYYHANPDASFNLRREE